ncbi:helix-turn-helix domain-containing protein [Actinoplanes sp. Pm04-4]|uniref:Helix-turn-helix domain-containing protein n=1 Tax=Paractinoplanes pyxinae TaxID=2997416 RepID=A0ABT4B4E1_9ACTN|nr:helix-turn-helix domain-containing protein [Actinoplanes pyxinae]MCY1141367.1 helix-turn-helix domain-containing protein [Actinoplanes pyxinae]
MANAHRPILDQERDRVRELHAAGASRNAIARELRRSGRTISRIAAELDLTFERSDQTRSATVAKVADGQARRAQLQLDALDAAGRLFGQMFAETKVYNFGGKENDYNERTHPEPPFRDKRDIATAIKALADTALKLAEYDKATGHEDEKSMLGDLFDQLRQARDADRQDAA